MATINQRRKLIVALSSILILAFALILVQDIRKPDPIPHYLANERSIETTVVIPEGASGDEIARVLYEKGVVKSPRSFFAAATANKLSRNIQPGTYRIETKIPGSEAVSQLLTRERRMLVLLVREGERAYELQDDLRALKFSESEINRIFGKKVLVDGFGTRDFEGFLFPATYNLTPDESVESVRDKLLNKFRKVIQDLDFIEQARLRDLSPYEALIIGSIVQAEGYDEEDFGKVATVIFNRLKIGMPLQMDSTVLYALKERRLAVSTKDVSIASAYNTYNRKGLPPTPIGNPGVKALSATLNPEPGDWLYFVTVAPTETKFTKSYDDFLRYKREFKRNLEAGLFDGKS